MNSEQRLWRAVVDKALLDATDYNPTEKPTSGGTSVFEQTNARNWLSSDSRNFRIVCEYADYEPKWVREQAKTLRANNWKRPELSAA